MATLLLIDPASGKRWRVWPEAEVLEPGAIQETASYLFELQDCAQAQTAELAIDDDQLEALRAADSATARWRWSPGFHAGLAEAEIRIPGMAPARFEITTDPDRRKLTREAFDSMVQEILEDTFALFSLSSFRRSVARGAGTRPPPIARLEYLRSRFEELEAVTIQIDKRPRRHLGSEEISVPYHQAAAITGPEILRSFQSGHIRKETSTRTTLPAALKGFLPSMLRVRRRQSSLDLPEHRQMAACLRAWAGWLTSVADMLATRTPGDPDDNLPKWARRCRTLSQRVNALSGLPAFAEAGDAPARLILSAVFRNDLLYRRFYRLWQDINLGIAAVFGDFLNLPLARTYELYELWCFLRLVRAATLLFGLESLDTRDLFIADSTGGVTLAAGAVSIEVSPGWTLCFQKTYQEFWKAADGRGTFSRPMIPDVVAAWKPQTGHSGRLIVLDAKYRIASGLNDALSSIHAYRDTLVEEAGSGEIIGIVTAAYLLAPHIPELAPGYRETGMPARLFHPAYRKDFRFGALTLKPGTGIDAAVEILRLIIVDASASEPAAAHG